MPSFKSTIENLVAIELDLLKQSRDSAWFRYANKEAVEKFYKLNANALAHFRAYVNALNASFLKKDDDGQVLFEVNEATGKEHYVFIDEASEIQYKSAMKDFGKQEVYIIY